MINLFNFLKHSIELTLSPQNTLASQFSFHLPGRIS